MPPFEINHLSLLKEFEGRELPATEWLILTQDRIQKFADATEDRQWIHVDPERAARESPYGGAIAHGFLTLSLVSYFAGQAIRVREGVGIRVNYGLNRVRFPSAVLMRTPTQLFAPAIYEEKLRPLECRPIGGRACALTRRTKSQSQPSYQRR